jgi:hypothetical protein
LTFDAHFLLYTLSHRARIKYFPITWREEDQISNAKVVRQGFIILKLALSFLILKNRVFENLPSKIVEYKSTIHYENSK